MINLETITFTQAAAIDWPEVERLLAAANLPLDGARDHLRDFILARDADGHLAGVAGIEYYGETGLLRSVAVAERRQGIGQAIVQRALDAARQSGAKQVVLLTTTASDFFRRHFGFVPVERSNYDQTFADSLEWRLPRCSSAACLALKLKTGKDEVDDEQ